MFYLVTTFDTQSSTTSSSTSIETPLAPNNVEFFDNTIPETKENKSETNNSGVPKVTPPVTQSANQEKSQEKEQTTKPKSYRDAIGKKEKVTPNITESQPTSATSTSTTTATATTTNAGTKSNKSSKEKKKAAKANANNNRAARGHPQDTNDYYDDSWYYGTSEEGYLSTGYTDDQEIFIGNLSAQVTENEVKQS